MARKTIEVNLVKDIINEWLELYDGHPQDEYRKGLCDALELILHKSDNYKGYLNIGWMNGGWKEWEEAGKPDNVDEYAYGKWGRFGRRYY